MTSRKVSGIYPNESQERVRKMQKVVVNAFCVIGKTGSTEEGPGMIQRLWKEANEHFAEVEPLAKKNAEGRIAGIWGVMTRSDMSFQPWEDNFTCGLYMAGVEAEEDAVAPQGWKKWIVPGFECFKVPVESPNTFSQTIDWMKQNGIELVAAVQDFTDPATQKSYMLFPIAWNNSKRELIDRIKAKTAPVAYCGFHCGHCFLMEWCGNCRSACNMCSYATLSSDNRCENEKCCTDKGFYGCYECSDLADCKKGFFKESAGSLPKACSLFIRKYGAKEYGRVLKRADEMGVQLREDCGADANLEILEGIRRGEAPEESGR